MNQLTKSSKKIVTYQAVNNFIIQIRCCAIDQIKRYLEEYDNIIVNRLQTQMRQPSLYFASILIDHDISYQIMKLLIQHGANPKFEDNYKQTVLFYVCRQGKQKCLQLLLDNNLDLNQKDCFGQTPIFYAAKQNKLNIIPILIANKAQTNVKDKLAQHTPLFYAAREGHYDMCKILIEKGNCDILHLDSNNKNPSYYAKKAGKNDVYQYLNGCYNAAKQSNKVISQSRQQSNVNDQRINSKKIKKRQVIGKDLPAKSMYRLFRSDAFGQSNEVSRSQFQQILQNYPILRDMIRSPDDIQMTNLQEIKLKDAWIKVAMKQLTICWKSKGGFYFHEPVDPSKFGIDDYFDIILQPMDFGTIKKKLTFNFYNNINQFIRDIMLVFDNCVKYNGKQNIIAKHALQIKQVFQQHMRQAGYLN